MNFDKLNNWFSVLSNLGVIAGLIFLAIEIDQSNNQNESMIIQARTDQLDQYYQASANSDYLPAIFEKVSNSGLSTLDPEELRRLRNIELARYIRGRGIYQQYQLGYMDEETYLTSMRAAVNSIDFWQELGVPASAYQEYYSALVQFASESN